MCHGKSAFRCPYGTRCTKSASGKGACIPKKLNKRCTKAEHNKCTSKV
jgi:hypothetical protein